MSFLSLSTTLLYSFACAVTGLSVIKLLSFENRLERQFSIFVIITSGFLLGQGIFANLWLFIGLASLFKAAIIWPFLIIIAIAGSYAVKDQFRPLHAETENILSQIRLLSWFWKFLLGFVFLLMFLYGMGAIALPPSGDAEAFYMVFPKIMAASERLRPQPNYYEFSQVGLFGEMHYAALMSIGTPAAAKFFTWFTSLALAVLLLSLCMDLGLSIKGLIIAIVILCTSSMYTNHITDGKVDIYGGALGLAAYYWAMQTGREGCRILPYMLTGIFAGFAVVAKFSNIPVILSGVLLIIIWNHVPFVLPAAHQARKVFIKYIYFVAIFCVFFSIPVIIHLVKNGMLFGEPFAPFVFLKGEGNPWADQAWFSPKTTRYILLTYPIALVFGKYPMQDGNISALIMVFMPFCFLLKKPESFFQSRLSQLSLVAAACLVTWMIVRPAVISPRYILATLVLFIPLAARSAENMLQISDGYTVLKKTVCFSLIFSLFIFFHHNRANAVQFGKFCFNKQVVCSGSSKSCNAFDFINKTVHEVEGHRVYMGGYYSYHMRADLLQCLPGPDDYGGVSYRSPKERWERFKTSEERWQHLFNRGFNYLLIQKASHKQLLDLFNPIMTPLWLDVKQVFDDEHSIIYSLFANDPNHKPQYICAQITPPAWDVVKNEMNQSQ